MQRTFIRALLTRLNKEAMQAAALTTIVIVFAVPLFGSPLSGTEVASLIVSMSVAGLCVRSDWTLVEQLTFPVVIALPLHLLLSHALDVIAHLWR